MDEEANPDTGSNSSPKHPDTLDKERPSPSTNNDLPGELPAGEKNGLFCTFIKVSPSDDEISEHGSDRGDEALLHMKIESESEYERQTSDDESYSESNSSSEEVLTSDTPSDEDNDTGDEEEEVEGKRRRRKRSRSYSKERTPKRRRRSRSKTEEEVEVGVAENIVISCFPPPEIKIKRKRGRKPKVVSEDEEPVVKYDRQPGRPYDPEFKMEVMKYAETHSNTATARRYGLTPKRVREWKSKRDQIAAEFDGSWQRRGRGEDFTIEDKLRAVAFAEEHSIAEATLLYNVHKRTIEKWKQKREKLESVLASGQGYRKRGQGCGRKPRFTHIENDLRDWLIALRLRGVTVNTKMILNKAKKLVEEGSSGQENVQAPTTYSWVEGFLTRNKLVGQLGTTLGNEDPSGLLALAKKPGEESNSTTAEQSQDPAQFELPQMEIPENPNKRHRRTITLQDKVKIIERIEKGETQTSVAASLKVAHSTVQTIWSSRKSIILRYMSPAKKTYADIDREVYKWYKESKSKGISINGKMMLTKAVELGESYHKAGFKAQVTTWAEKFCRRHKIEDIDIPSEDFSVPDEGQIPSPNVTSVQPLPTPVQPSAPNSAYSTTSDHDHHHEEFSSPPDFCFDGLTTVLHVENRNQPQNTSHILQQPESVSSSVHSQIHSSFVATEYPNSVSSTTSLPTNVSTYDAVNALELLRHWVRLNGGASQKTLNKHLESVEGAIRKRRNLEIAAADNLLNQFR